MTERAGILLENKHHIIHHNWLLIWIISLLVVYLIMRLVFTRYWRRYRMAMIYPQEAAKLFKERNINLLQAAFILNSLAVLSISLYLFLWINLKFDLSWPAREFKQLILFTILVSSVTALRFMSMELLGFLFRKQKLTAELNLYWLIYLKNGGFYLLLCSILLEYFPEEMKIIPIVIGLGILAILFIFNLIRSTAVLLANKVSLFYGILYLCTLEILPVVMIVSMVLS